MDSVLLTGLGRSTLTFMCNRFVSSTRGFFAISNDVIMQALLSDSLSIKGLVVVSDQPVSGCIKRAGCFGRGNNFSIDHLYKF